MLLEAPLPRSDLKDRFACILPDRAGAISGRQAAAVHAFEYLSAPGGYYQAVDDGHPGYSEACFRSHIWFTVHHLFTSVIAAVRRPGSLISDTRAKVTRGCPFIDRKSTRLQPSHQCASR